MTDPLDASTVVYQTIRPKADVALAANAAFLALAPPTQAQAVAQVQLLTKECTALIRMMLGILDTADGT